VVGRFGKESFDVVILTELLEHAKNWQLVISNMKNVCKPGGILIVTTRSRGFGYHGFPYDFWRYELDDFREIFSDLNIVSLEKDTELVGVFTKLRKPLEFKERDLANYKLYSILTNTRTAQVTEKDSRSLRYLRFMVREKLKKIVRLLIQSFKKVVPET